MAIAGISPTVLRAAGIGAGIAAAGMLTAAFAIDFTQPIEPGGRGVMLKRTLLFGGLVTLPALGIAARVVGGPSQARLAAALIAAGPALFVGSLTNHLLARKVLHTRHAHVGLLPDDDGATDQPHILPHPG